MKPDILGRILFVSLAALLPLTSFAVPTTRPVGEINKSDDTDAQKKAAADAAAAAQKLKDSTITANGNVAVVTVSDYDFQSISTAMASKTPYGGTWVQIYGGVLGSPSALQPCALIGGLMTRDSVILHDEKNESDHTKDIIVPIDISFLRDHWAIAHQVKQSGIFGGIGRFGVTFGVSTGSLASLQSSQTDTTSTTTTSYFFGLTYFINPQMTFALGPVAQASDGLSKLHLGATVSIDLSILGKFFGAKQ